MIAKSVAVANLLRRQRITNPRSSKTLVIVLVLALDPSSCFWIGEVHSKRELGLNPKPRHFKPFEYFDHTSYTIMARGSSLDLPLHQQIALQ
jgi:hypothetical protein